MLVGRGSGVENTDVVLVVVDIAVTVDVLHVVDVWAGDVVFVVVVAVFEGARFVVVVVVVVVAVLDVLAVVVVVDVVVDGQDAPPNSNHCGLADSWTGACARSAICCLS